MTNNNNIKRFIVISIIIATIIFIIISRYFYIMVILSKNNINTLNSRPIVERGPILDRNGKVLAIQTQLNSVTAWIPNIDDINTTAKKIGPLLKINSNELLAKLKKRSGFVYIKRKISPTESKSIKELIDKGELKGISLEPEFGRNYPEKKLAAHLIGITGTDNNGLDGIEFIYDDILYPKKNKTKEKHVYGNQIFLTIDLNIQYFVQKYVEKIYLDSDADSVMALVMNSKNGEFLAWVSVPSFDPNDLSTYDNMSKLNRPVSFAYEPGSVFKVFTISSIMELGGINDDTHFYCNGYFEKYLEENQKIRINCLGHHGDVNPQRIIQFSCNSGAAYASETIDSESFYQMIKLFGFGQSTLLPLPGESNGLLRKPDSWSSRSKPTIAIGQEVSVSAVQMITAATAITNKGVLLRPRIIKKIVSPEGKIIESFSNDPQRQVLSEETAKKMLEMMFTSTQGSGTARRLRIDGINIAAKTGTAELLDRKTGKYSENSFIASCIAIVPYEDPEIIIYLAIENPKKISHFGGVLASPVVKNITKELIPYLGISKKSDKIINTKGEITVKKLTKITIGKTIPNLIGLSKKEILPLFKRSEISIKLSGEGWVVKQSPPPGTKIHKNMKIELELQ